MGAKKKTTAKKTTSKTARSRPKAAVKATSSVKAKKGSDKKSAATAKRKAPAGKTAAAPAKKRPAAATRKPAAKQAPVMRSNRKAPSDLGEKSGNGATETSARNRANRHLTSKELKLFERLLLNLRDQVVDEISFLTGDNLSTPQLERTGEEGTDNFNREFALKLVSSEQDIIYEIDEALRRIKNGTYGLCESSGERIEKERLKVLPHARHCVRVQSELEKGRARYRPFGPTISRA